MFLANHVATDAVCGKSNMAGDENFMWSNEEINLLLHIVIDYKTGKNRGWRSETIAIRSNMYCNSPANLAMHAAAAWLLIYLTCFCFFCLKFNN